MPKVLTTGMPPEVHLYGGWIAEFAAIDPTTGADVANVKVGSITIELDLAEGTTAGELAVGDFMLVPGPGA